jgi:hypothetical protein
MDFLQGKNQLVFEKFITYIENMVIHVRILQKKLFDDL